MVSEQKHIKPDFFIKLYKASMMWNKILFYDVKIKMVKERRELMAKSQDKEYKELCA
jgi:hypothetical protein